MTATQTAINPKMVDRVWRQFITQARGESAAADSFTLEMLEAEYAADEPLMDEWTWRGDKRVVDAIEAVRGLSPDQQYKKGIVSMPSRMAGWLISQRMRQIFGIELLSQMEHFSDKGEFQISHRHDIIAPVKKDGLIIGVRFYTISEMKKW